MNKLTFQHLISLAHRQRCDEFYFLRLISQKGSKFWRLEMMSLKTSRSSLSVSQREMVQRICTFVCVCVCVYVSPAPKTKDSLLSSPSLKIS